MYRLKARITIEGRRRWRIGHITSCTIERDTESLTDTCQITLPRRMYWDGRQELPLERGDRVEVALGYDDALEVVFVGYIRDIGIKTPVVLSCEDEMYRLKSLPARKRAYRSVTLSELLHDQGITSPIKVMGEQRLGAYRVTADNVAALLGKLKEQGIRSFYRYEDGQAVLYSGVLFDHEVGKRRRQVLATGVNIISDEQLKQQSRATLRLKVKAISLQPNGKKKIKVEVGDADGELRTLHTYNKDAAALKAWAEQELERMRQDGLTGTVVTFAARPVDKLDHVGIKLHGKRMGVYQARKVVLKYGAEGYHQEVTLGYRVAP